MPPPAITSPISRAARWPLPANMTAAAMFDAMQKDFPQSDWLRRARLAKAVALARKGDFRTAELIVRAEAEHLLSADRKQQIADIYLEFADRLFKPPKDAEKPDYARALEFYRKALEVGPKPAKRIEVEMLAAECVHACKIGKRRRRCTRNSSRTIRGMRCASKPASAWASAGWPKAIASKRRRAWQDLSQDSPPARPTSAAAASPWIADAQFQLARTWNIPKPENDEQLNQGVAALRAFLERFPAHKLAGPANLEIAGKFCRARPA